MENMLGAGRERALTIEQLRTFHAVATSEGVSSAALLVNKSQSAVTQNIKSLEAIVGSELFFRRRGHYYGLTQSGEIFFHYVVVILSAAAEAMDKIEAPSFLNKARVGVPLDFGVISTKKFKMGLAEIIPNTIVEIITAYGNTQKKLLNDGKLDLAIVRELDDGRAEIPKFYSKILRRESLVWLGTHSESHEFDDIPVIDLVLFPEGCIFRQAIIEAITSAGKSWRITYESSSYVDIKAAVSNGFGVTAIPETCLVNSDSETLLQRRYPSLPNVSTRVYSVMESETVDKVFSLIRQVYL